MPTCYKYYVFLAVLDNLKCKIFFVCQLWRPIIFHNSYSLPPRNFFISKGLPTIFASLLACLNGNVMARVFFFVSTIQIFFFSWLLISLVIMKLMYGCQKLYKFLHLFTKQLLYRHNIQALNKVILSSGGSGIRMWNFNVETSVLSRLFYLKNYMLLY